MVVHARERVLRGAIVAAGGMTPAAIATNVAPHWLVPAFIGVACIVFASVPAGFVTLFYAVWIIGWLTEGEKDSAELVIGESRSMDVPRPYWPWSRRIKSLRLRKNIARLEREIGVPHGERWYG